MIYRDDDVDRRQRAGGPSAGETYSATTGGGRCGCRAPFAGSVDPLRRIPSEHRASQTLAAEPKRASGRGWGLGPRGHNRRSVTASRVYGQQRPNDDQGAESSSSCSSHSLTLSVSRGAHAGAKFAGRRLVDLLAGRSEVDELHAGADAARDGPSLTRRASWGTAGCKAQVVKPKGARSIRGHR